MRRLSYLWREHRVLSLAFVMALALTTVFLFRIIVGMVYWADPMHQDRPLEMWMTPRYISMSFDLPREEVLDALGIKEGELKRPTTLRRISEHTGVDIKGLEAAVEDAATKFRASHP
ncbi:hypothetical protein AB9F26_11305 [Falsihalocynthiibacter sp. BN13B15]|uniref:hypothetical protein n=1 Tax=Falsihalocynthiibacter sp. BN13B15 TaxID=3240871 RepID=UPI00350F1772